MSAMIPGDISTEVAIKTVDRYVKDAKSPLLAVSVYGLDDRREMCERVLNLSVRMGDDLSEVRSWAMQVAMLRDCVPTFAEREAARS